MTKYVKQVREHALLGPTSFAWDLVSDQEIEALGPTALRTLLVAELNYVGRCKAAVDDEDVLVELDEREAALWNSLQGA